MTIKKTLIALISAAALSFLGKIIFDHVTDPS